MSIEGQAVASKAGFLISIPSIGGSRISLGSLFDLDSFYSKCVWGELICLCSYVEEDAIYLCCEGYL
jgi:hypothetical protein